MFIVCPFVLPLSAGTLQAIFLNPGMLILCSIGAVIIELAIMCNKDLGRRVPMNYFLLGVFTLFESYIVASSSLIYSGADPALIIAAVLMTAVVVSGLTVYAWTTPSDFTMA